MSDKIKCAGIEIETSQDNTDLHLYPRESRRGKAQWAMWVKSDGSAILFAGREQIVLPKNAPGVVKGFYLQVNGKTGQKEFVPDSRIMCTDSACSLMGFAKHEFGKGCRLYKG